MKTLFMSIDWRVLICCALCCTAAVVFVPATAVVLAVMVGVVFVFYCVSAAIAASCREESGDVVDADWRRLPAERPVVRR